MLYTNSKGRIDYSKAILWLNFILSILIVFLHTDVTAEIVGKSVVYENLKRIINVIADCAVPSFFLISSYLLFVNYGYEKYLEKVKKRIGSLVIPYFIWSIIGIIYQLSLKLLLNNNSKMRDGIFKSLLLASCNQPLWFIRCLFFFAILSPAYYWIVKKLGKFSFLLVIGMIIINIFIHPGYSSILFWSPVFSLGTIGGMFYKDLIQTESHKRKWYDYYFVLLIMEIIIVTYGFYSYEKPSLYYIYRLVNGCAITYLFWRIPWKSAPKSWGQNSFFTFCSHALLLGIIPKFFSKVIVHNQIGLCLIYIFSVSVIITITILIAQLLKRIAPSFLKILVGKRVDRN